MTLSNNSTPAQSIEIVDPEGSCKEVNQEPVLGICPKHNQAYAYCPMGCLDREVLITPIKPVYEIIDVENNFNVENTDCVLHSNGKWVFVEKGAFQ